MAFWPFNMCFCLTIFYTQFHLQLFSQFGELVSLTIECMWHLELHSLSGQWWQLSLGSPFLLFQQELFLVEGGRQSAPGLGLQRVSSPWSTRFWFHRCMQFVKPFPDTEAEQLCGPWCALPVIPKPAMVGNVSPSPSQPVPCPGRFHPALLASYRASQVFQQATYIGFLPIRDHFRFLLLVSQIPLSCP